MKPEQIRSVLRENYPRFCTVVLKDGRRYRTRILWSIVMDHEMFISGIPPRHDVWVPLDQIVRVIPPRAAARNRSNHRRKAAKTR